jgi:hypothetical protein
LYPSDALAFVEKDGAQYNYGHKSGYFDGLIATVKSVDETAFAELITIIERAEALADKAYDELKDEKYSTVSEYSNTFNDGRTQYQMDSHIDFDAQMKSVYTAFSDWLASWEL